jgi:hypothetical protein
MASQAVSGVNSFTDGLRRRWVAVSGTVVGDILATALAISLICLLFLACTFAILGCMRAAEFVVYLMG